MNRWIDKTLIPGERQIMKSITLHFTNTEYIEFIHKKNNLIQEIQSINPKFTEMSDELALSIMAGVTNPEILE